MKKAALIAIILVLCSSNLSFAATFGFTYGDNTFNDPAPPRLRYPINETAVLATEAALEFSWWNDLLDTRGFILKVYKGYNMYGDNLILKEELPQDVSRYSADSGLFDDGQVYTWSLLRVTGAGYKSERSFNSFKVVRKNG